MSFDLADVETIYADDPKLKKDDVKTLFEWLKKQPHLPELTELQVILFLHSCHYSLEATKTTIDSYFTLRTTSDLFECATVDVIKRLLSLGSVLTLPKKTPEGYVVLLMKLLDPRTDLYVNLEHLKLIIMTVTLYFHQTGPVNGLLVLIDMEGVSLGHLARFNLRGMKQCVTFLQEAAPTRLKGIYHINVNPVTEHLVAILKPFLKKEIHDQIQFHSSLDSLYQYVPKECLPQEYGGKLPPLLQFHEKHRQNLIGNLDFFKWHDTQKVDERKRPETFKGMLGSDVQGSFKKLEVD